MPYEHLSMLLYRNALGTIVGDFSCAYCTPTGEVTFRHECTAAGKRMAQVRRRFVHAHFDCRGSG
jgi:hypothetical protein